MQWLQGVVIMVLMLLLRLAVPVAITFGLGYTLHRLDVRWHPATPTPSTVAPDNRQGAAEAPVL